MKIKGLAVGVFVSLSLVSCKKYDCECTTFRSLESGVISVEAVENIDVKGMSQTKAIEKCNAKEKEVNTGTFAECSIKQ